MESYQLENLNNKSDKIHSCLKLKTLDKVFEGVCENAHRQLKQKEKKIGFTA